MIRSSKSQIVRAAAALARESWLLEDDDRFDGLDGDGMRELSGIIKGEYDRQRERIAELEAVLKAVDLALESEFGGFYLSAPDGDPLCNVREMLRGER